jgi:hypothetical protein
MFSGDEISQSFARFIYLLIACSVLFGGCCGGLGMHLWKTYSVTVEVKEKGENGKQ